MSIISNTINNCYFFSSITSFLGVVLGFGVSIKLFFYKKNTCNLKTLNSILEVKLMFKQLFFL